MLLQCESLTKSFSGVPVLRGVSLGVEAGRVLGIAGENGAGKSTLMNLIGGVHKPDSGSMLWNGAPYVPSGPLDAERHGISFVHQELNLFPNLSIADNVFLLPRIDRRTKATRTRDLLTRVGLDLDPAALVETLPPGDRQLVEIAKALRSEAQMVILDEPTTSLSSREIDRLFAVVRDLRSRGISLLYITHALEHLLGLSDSILVLRDGAVVDSGAVAEFDENRLVTSMVGRPVTQLFPPRDRRSSGQTVLEVRGVSEPGVVENIGFDLAAGEILGVAGQMGSGRTELARILFGLDRASAGTVSLKGVRIERLRPRERIRLGLAYVTESRREDGLFMDATLAENMRIVQPSTTDVAELVSALRIACSDPDRQPVSQLSGGNQQKVALGKWLAAQPSVLILDEPTRGIDVGAKQEIYAFIARLAAGGMALLVISSEIEELLGLCDRVMVMAKGEVRGMFVPGDGREAIMRAAL
jgi:ribose transport system ATP-binding protein